MVVLGFWAQDLKERGVAVQGLPAINPTLAPNNELPFLKDSYTDIIGRSPKKVGYLGSRYTLNLNPKTKPQSTKVRARAVILNIESLRSGRHTASSLWTLF